MHISMNILWEKARKYVSKKYLKTAKSYHVDISCLARIDENIAPPIIILHHGDAYRISKSGCSNDSPGLKHFIHGYNAFCSCCGPRTCNDKFLIWNNRLCNFCAIYMAVLIQFTHSFLMIVGTFIFYLIIIIKSEVWPISRFIGLGHEALVCAVYLSILLCLYDKYDS